MSEQLTYVKIQTTRDDGTTLTIECGPDYGWTFSGPVHPRHLRLIEAFDDFRRTQKGRESKRP